MRLVGTNSRELFGGVVRRQSKRDLPNFALDGVVQNETIRGRRNREEGALGDLRLGEDLHRDSVAALIELLVNQHLVFFVLAMAIDDINRPANPTDRYRHNADDRHRHRCRPALRR